MMLMSWFIFLGAAVGVRENYHLGFDVLLYVLPPAHVAPLLLVVTDLLVFGLRRRHGRGTATELAVGTWSAAMPALAISRRLRLSAARRRRRADRALRARELVRCCWQASEADVGSPSTTSHLVIAED